MLEGINKKITGKTCGVFLIILFAVSVQSCSLNRQGAGPAAQLPASGCGGVEDLGPEGCFDAAFQARLLGKTHESQDKLKWLEETRPGSLWSKRAAFLLGMDALESNDPGAARYFEDASGLAGMEDYVQLHLARAYRKGGRLEPALETYNSLIEKNPESLTMPSAVFERALTLEEYGRRAEALAALNAFISAYPENPLIPEALFKTATIYLETNGREEALKKLREILVRYPGGEKAAEALRIFEGLKEDGGEAQGFSADERLARGKAFFISSQFKAASREFLLVMEQGGAEHIDGAYLPYIRTLFRLRKYGDAEKALKEFLGRDKNDLSDQKKALFLLATAALRQDKVELFLRSSGALLKRFPKSAAAARTLLLKGRFYERRAEPDNAFREYGKVLSRFKNTGSGAEALWRVGWMEYNLKRFGESHKTFSSWRARPFIGGARAKFIYWDARSLENTGRMDEAAAEYEKVCAGGFGYYCMRARERLGLLMPDTYGGKIDITAVADETEPSEAYALDIDYGASPELFKDRHYLAARELLTLGLTEEAAREFRLFEQTQTPDRKALFDIMRLFYRAGDFHHAINIYGRYFTILNGKAEGIRAELLRISFPMKVVEYIKEKGLSGAVDPLLVAAVIREESTFNPGDVSRTGAIGLMQIMPDTARFIAMKSGVEYRAASELTEPDTNIRLGSWYLAYLLRKFNDDVVMTIAGYNAGPKAVKRWVSELSATPDEFIESIPYPETRNYTKKVLKSYTIFKLLAGAGSGEGEEVSSSESVIYVDAESKETQQMRND